MGKHSQRDRLPVVQTISGFHQETPHTGRQMEPDSQAQALPRFLPLALTCSRPLIPGLSHGLRGPTRGPVLSGWGRNTQRTPWLPACPEPSGEATAGKRGPRQQASCSPTGTRPASRASRRQGWGGNPDPRERACPSAAGLSGSMPAPSQVMCPGCLDPDAVPTAPSPGPAGSLGTGQWGQRPWGPAGQAWQGDSSASGRKPPLTRDVDLEFAALSKGAVDGRPARV